MPESEYIEMICYLADQPKIENILSKEFQAKPLHTASEEELYACYYAAFQAGDADFFFRQSEVERREYFDTLGLDQAKDEPASVLVTRDEAIVGFTYVIPFGEGNRHISCMAVHPDYQRRKLGTFMLQYAKEKAAAQECQSITLGTDTTMGAFNLYRKQGFEILVQSQS